MLSVRLAECEMPLARTGMFIANVLPDWRWQLVQWQA
jgi:hypothetical protein